MPEREGGTFLNTLPPFFMHQFLNVIFDTFGPGRVFKEKNSSFTFSFRPDKNPIFLVKKQESQNAKPPEAPTPRITCVYSPASHIDTFWVPLSPYRLMHDLSEGAPSSSFFGLRLLCEHAPWNPFMNEKRFYRWSKMDAFTLLR